MSFRSVKEAVEAAKDGDQVILLPGIHNGMGYDSSAKAAAQHYTLCTIAGCPCNKA